MSTCDVDESVCEVSDASHIMVGPTNTLNYSPCSLDVDCVVESPDASSESTVNPFLSESASSKDTECFGMNERFQNDTEIGSACSTPECHSPSESLDLGSEASTSGLDDKDKDEDDQAKRTSVAMVGLSNTLNVVLPHGKVRSFHMERNTKVNIKYNIIAEPSTESHQETRKLRITIDMEGDPSAMDAVFANYHRPKTRLKQNLDQLFDRLDYVIDLITPGSIVIELRPTTSNSIQTLLESIENGQFDNIVKELLKEESVFKMIAGKEVTVTVDLSIPEELIQKAGTSLIDPTPVLSDVTVSIREEGNDGDNSSHSSSVDPPDPQEVEEEPSTSVDPVSAGSQDDAAFSMSRSSQMHGRPGRLGISSLRGLQDCDPSVIITHINQDIRGYKTILSRKDPTPKDFKLIVSVLCKAVHCESMPEWINVILSTVVSTPFFRTSYINVLSHLDANDLRQVTLESFPIFREILRRMPSDGWPVVNTVALLSRGLISRNDIKDVDIIKCAEELDDILRLTKPQTPEMNVSTDRQDMDDDEEPGTPPENFRDLPVIPKKEELDGTEEIFLLRNKVGTRFKDLEHYLECQFRLFRADVIMPLKKNIQAFKRADEDAFTDYRTYADVHILRPVCSLNGLCYRLAFDIRHLQKVKWESSQRLIYGSLLCLSSDKFTDDILFATVDSRDPERLKQGLVDVRFLSDLPHSAYRTRGIRFDMVESPAYFEAYKDVLICMKHLSESNLPFQEYIVKCGSIVKEPLYLRKQRDALYDLQPLVDETFKVSDRRERHCTEKSLKEPKSARNIKIQDKGSWPQIEGLDGSQFKALHNALTREFALIQGPPGTGKTYIGTHILKTLLHNSDVWLRGQKHLPILVVCYTNHALDQFLGGMLNVFQGKLIRVGGRFTTELMKKHSLKNARDGIKKQKAVPSHIHEAKMTILRKIESLKRTIHLCAAKLEVAKREILHENCLINSMDEKLRRQFPQEGLSPRGSIIMKWLGVDADLALTERTSDQGYRTEDDSDGEDSGEEGTSLNDHDLPGNRRQIVQDLLQILDLDFDFDIEDTLDEGEPPETEDQVAQKYMAFSVTNLGDGKVSRFNSSQERRKQMETLQRKRKLRQRLMTNITSIDTMTSDEEKRVSDIWKLPNKDRWRLYRYWVDLFCEHAWEEITLREGEYEKCSLRFQEILLQGDKLILAEADIIGMTTTAAARYQKILNEIGPKVIIIEEAAEVLEAHVIGTLSKGCEHLILIGDHKQLRPNPTVHELAKKYNLEISLFERMVKSGLHCDTLEWQHRMRPEIAEIIRPIYPQLKDHDVVKAYGNVKGVSRNIYFIEHQQQHFYDEETKSFENFHEAEYLAGLCKYLLKQGYEKEQITILSTYSAQIRRLRFTLKKQQIKDVSVVAVDSYQGEENDIVLLSLVRSGNKGSIGFLKEENRVCVALSRAKIGLYVIGNFTHIAEHSDLWKEICKKATICDNLGPALVLSCQRHPDTAHIAALDPTDFASAPEGGCDRHCNYRLPCGHVCTKVCHSNDPQHIESLCLKPCKKRCKNGHSGCGEPCYKPCPPCEVPVQVKLQTCGHTQTVPCHVDAGRYQCLEPITVTKSCGHSSSVACGRKDTEPCNYPCKAQMTCGHLCQGTCGSCHNGRLHQPCTAKCSKILICGHECQSTCNSCPPCEKPCENRCSHGRCSLTCGDPCVPCSKPCDIACRHAKCTSSCGDMCNRKRCNDKCRGKRLKCNHLCIGICEAPCPSVCKQCNPEEISKALEVFGTEMSRDTRFIQLEDCSHIFDVKAMDKYMEEDSREGGKTVVQLKKCPSCQTPIRRNQRYVNIIKGTLSDIEKVKLKVRENERRVRELQQIIYSIKSRFQGSDRVIVDRLTTTNPVSSEGRLSAQINQLRIIERVIGLEKLVRSDANKYGSDLYDQILDAIHAFKEWLVVPRSSFGQQQRQDSDGEMKRLSMSRFLISASHFIDSEGKSISADMNMRLQGIIQRLASPEKHESVLPDAKLLVEEVKGHVSEFTIGPCDDERVEIVEAIGLRQGHWYKCKEGHVYAVGECGRVYEEATCPECGGSIGGAAHRLTEDNAWASEMDDAEDPPWSEERDYEFALMLDRKLNG